MIAFEEALQTILAQVSPLGRVRRILEKLPGMVLSEDVKAPFDMPRFNNSAMDGYGLMAADVSELPTDLQIAGTLQAGNSGKIRLKPGEAVRLYTGAPVPGDVDTVVMQEDVTEKSGPGKSQWVTISKPVKKGSHIRHKGEEFKKGQTILTAGTVVTPPVVGMLASMGYPSAFAYRKPRISLISTGNELVEPGKEKELEPGQIYDSNTYAIMAALKNIGIDQSEVFNARDERYSTRRAFEKALDEGDVVISMGGISVGDYDFVKDAAESLGIQTLFWRIAIKPGKPVYFGRKKDKFIFGLPGNPVSVLVTYHQLVEPALLKMMGYPVHEPRRQTARLTASLKKRPGRLEFVRGILSRTEAGYVVSPATGQQSHMLGGLAASNCLIDFPLDAEELAEGQEVSVIWLGWSPDFQRPLL